MARSENWLQWVLKKQSEVGEGVCYLLDQLEGAGDSLEVWGWILDAQVRSWRPEVEDWCWWIFGQKTVLSV